MVKAKTQKAPHILLKAILPRIQEKRPKKDNLPDQSSNLKMRPPSLVKERKVSNKLLKRLLNLQNPSMKAWNLLTK